jgi:hypothetical protein
MIAVMDVVLHYGVRVVLTAVSPRTGTNAAIQGLASDVLA